MNHHIEVSQLSREYDDQFRPDEEYLSSMPDLQNGEFVGLPINFVGMAGIKRPLKIRTRDGGIQEVLASIIGHVDNDANSRGINMSRLNRELASFDIEVFDIKKLRQILQRYRQKLNRFEAGLSIEFEYRMRENALRSVTENGDMEGGWLYVPVEFEVFLGADGKMRNILWVTYIYSSTCPCSTELAMHAAYTRGKAGSPHAQRSIARIGVEFGEDDMVWIEDIIDACKRAVPTQVQVFVKRCDEQAFGELCASRGTVFVEDAIRLFAEQLNQDSRILDYKIMCVHRESLHPWEAHSVLVKNVTGSWFTPTFNFGDLKNLTRFA